MGKKKKLLPRGERQKICMELFDQGQEPGSPALQETGISKSSIQRYYYEWKKIHNMLPPPADPSSGSSSDPSSGSSSGSSSAPSSNQKNNGHKTGATSPSGQGGFIPPFMDPIASFQLVQPQGKMNYTPIMRMARQAAWEMWGWDPAAPLENFIDSCLIYLFRIFEAELPDGPIYFGQQTLYKDTIAEEQAKAKAEIKAEVSTTPEKSKGEE
jgi:hypothetical protein